MIDLNSRTMTQAVASDAINAAIDAGLQAKRRLQEPRRYLGASAIGDACERRVQFDYVGAPRETAFSGKTLRIFDRGHVWEEVAKGWLHDAGFRITQRNQRTGELFSFATLDGRFKGHVDGVVIDGPQVEGVGYPCLWEHKAVGSKSYTAIVKNGLTRERPAYADQVAIYQAYIDGLNEHPAIFTITNTDSCEQTHLTLSFDAERAQRASDRAVKIITASEREELLPRPFASADNFECRGCAFKTRCWLLPS